MIDILNSLDADLLLFFNGLHSGFFDRFMVLASSRWVWLPMYCGLFMILLRITSPKMTLLYSVGLFFAIALTDQTCATLIRPAIERMRPSNPDNPLSALVHIVDGYRGGRYGFPSCHGANSAALLVFMGCVMRRRLYVWVLASWALLHVYSRIYLGVHYPGDIICGAAIGSVISYSCYRIAAWFDNEPDMQRRDKIGVPVFTVPLGKGRSLPVSAGGAYITIYAGSLAVMLCDAAV